MTAEIIKFEKEEPNGFVAGTLVHTDKGLVPIEEIKIGDMVLSKSESGIGELSDKKVIQTFVSPKKHRIFRLVFSRWDESIGQITSFIFATSNLPFFVKNHIVTFDSPRITVNGWVPLSDLKCGDVIETLNEHEFVVIGVDEVDYVIDNIGLCHDISNHDYGGILVDFSTRPFTVVAGIDPVVRDWSNDLSSLNYDDCVEVYNGINSNSLVDVWSELSPSRSAIGGWMEQLVYNFKVDESHTYYVGNAGIWVHDVRLSKNNDSVKILKKNP